MMRFNRFYQRAALSALLACFSLTVSSNDFQDANKLFKNGQNAQALNKIDTFLLNQPKDAQARFLKGVILTEQGQTEEALHIFTALTEDYPELPEPYNNLAVLYASQGQYDKAKVALEKAIRTHPSYATAHENLGDIYAKMASQAYDRALQLDRSNTSSKTKLALVKDLFNPNIKASGNGKTQIASAASTPVTPAATPVTVAVASSAASSTALASAHAASKTEPVAGKPVVTEAASANPDDEVLKAMHEWAKAWSSKNTNKYLAMYAKDFKTPNNESRSSWEQQRRERIAKPQPIVVSISNAAVKMLDDNHARVSFIQSYRSGALKATTRKTLEMSKNNGAWQITVERSGA
jgi:tetratricopeptide (TPR) repeat protein